MPTQATSNAMFRRLREDFLARRYPEQMEAVVRAHSRAREARSSPHAVGDDPRTDTARAELGIFANTIRLSIGLEEPSDLEADLDHALTAAKAR